MSKRGYSDPWAPVAGRPSGWTPPTQRPRLTTAADDDWPVASAYSSSSSSSASSAWGKGGGEGGGGGRRGLAPRRRSDSPAGDDWLLPSPNSSLADDYIGYMSDPDDEELRGPAPLEGVPKPAPVLTTAQRSRLYDDREVSPGPMLTPPWKRPAPPRSPGGAKDDPFWIDSPPPSWSNAVPLTDQRPRPLLRLPPAVDPDGFPNVNESPPVSPLARQNAMDHLDFGSDDDDDDGPRRQTRTAGGALSPASTLPLSRSVSHLSFDDEEETEEDTPIAFRGGGAAADTLRIDVGGGLDSVAATDPAPAAVPPSVRKLHLAFTGFVKAGSVPPPPPEGANLTELELSDANVLATEQTAADWRNVWTYAATPETIRCLRVHLSPAITEGSGYADAATGPLAELLRTAPLLKEVSFTDRQPFEVLAAVCTDVEGQVGKFRRQFDKLALVVNRADLEGMGGPLVPRAHHVSLRYVDVCESATDRVPSGACAGLIEEHGRNLLVLRNGAAASAPGTGAEIAVTEADRTAAAGAAEGRSVMVVGGHPRFVSYWMPLMLGAGSIVFHNSFRITGIDRLKVDRFREAIRWLGVVPPLFPKANYMRAHVYVDLGGDATVAHCAYLADRVVFATLTAAVGVVLHFAVDDVPWQPADAENFHRRFDGRWKDTVLFQRRAEWTCGGADVAVEI